MRVDVQQIAAGALRQLPKTFDPAWLKHAWAGEHGSLGMQARMHTIASEVALEGDRLFGASKAHGSVTIGDDRLAGEIERSVKLTGDGRLTAHHDLLQLKPFAQAKGYATGLNEDAYGRYVAAGVGDVKLRAGLDLGGLVWAKAGFELDIPGAQGAELVLARAHNIRRIVNDAYEGRSLYPEMLEIERRLIGASETRLRPDTITGVAQLAESKEGARILKTTGWDGVRLLDTPQPWASRVASEPYEAMQTARDGVDALLPDALSASRLASTLEHATADLPLRVVSKGGGNGATRIDLVDPEVRASAIMAIQHDTGRSHQGEYVLKASASGSELHATSDSMPSFSDGTDPLLIAPLHQRVRDTLASLGVDTLSAREHRGHRIGPVTHHQLS